MCYQDQTSPVHAYLLHLDEALARSILRQLREREIKNPLFKLNEARTTIKFDQSCRLSDLSGECLKRMFDIAVPNSYLDYVKNKANWLQKLENENNNWHFNILFENEDAIAAMANCFLGYEKPFNITSVRYKSPMGIPGKIPPHPEQFKPGMIKPMRRT